MFTFLSLETVSMPNTVSRRFIAFYISQFRFITIQFLSSKLFDFPNVIHFRKTTLTKISDTWKLILTEQQQLRTVYNARAHIFSLLFGHMIVVLNIMCKATCLHQLLFLLHIFEISHRQ